MPGFKTAKSVMFAASLGLAGVGLAPASAHASTEVIFCNHTGATISIAMIYMDVTTGKWMLSAWKNRTGGQCGSAGAIKTGLFYYHAYKANSAVSWPSGGNIEKTFCVPQAGVTRPSGSVCGVGEKRYGFRGVVPNEGKYTFTFK